MGPRVPYSRRAALTVTAKAAITSTSDIKVSRKKVEVAVLSQIRNMIKHAANTIIESAFSVMEAPAPRAAFQKLEEEESEGHGEQDGTQAELPYAAGGQRDGEAGNVEIGARPGKGDIGEERNDEERHS